MKLIDNKIICIAICQCSDMDSTNDIMKYVTLHRITINVTATSTD